MKQTWGNIKDGSVLIKSTPGNLHFDMTDFQAIFIVLTKKNFGKQLDYMESLMCFYKINPVLSAQ